MDSLFEFVLTLERVHRDEFDLIHYARNANGNDEHSTMPVTPFVYEFFLYNSLYSVDWEKSLTNGYVFNYADNSLKERPKQRKFEQLLKQLAAKNPGALYEAFSPLAAIPLEGDWTRITPDAYISLNDGKQFFKNLSSLQQLVQNRKALDVQRLDEVFARIENCRIFIYKVRNNIFHGSKRLGEIWETSQRKRIEVYRLFLTCLITSFFLLIRDQIPHE
jgi:hypothetical protein